MRPPKKSHFVCLVLMMATSLIALSLISSTSLASFSLPHAMTSGDRQEALRIIGFGTSAKSLTDPYSLGGYSGLEVGVSLETIPTEDLARLGSHLPTSQSDVTIPKFTIGKGLYSNLDFFIHFIPYSQQTELSQYGGILRWSFFEASSLPLSASLVAHFNTGNVSNQLTTRTYGLDLIGGINVNEVSLYAGIGGVQATGNFVGGSTGLTDSSRLEIEGVSTLHTLVGGSFRIKNVFVAAQLDRYSQSVISAKLGIRF
ncbi:hypothetical protein BH10BDE1_BH10BDE1_32210 [soil metagenome]